MFLALLYSSAFLVIPCAATVVWSDDFEDGDLDEWIIGTNSAVIDGCYRGVHAPDSFGVSSMCRACNITAGRWSFDALDVGDWGSCAGARGLHVRFMGTDPNEGPQNGYQLQINIGAKQDGEAYSYLLVKTMNGANEILASHNGMEGADLRKTLHHMEIARTSTGQMSVYLNRTQILQASDNAVSTSEYFYIRLTYDFALDNIVVDDEILLGGGVPMELLAIGIGIAAVVVTAVILHRRR